MRRLNRSRHPVCDRLAESSARSATNATAPVSKFVRLAARWLIALALVLAVVPTTASAQSRRQARRQIAPPQVVSPASVLESVQESPSDVQQAAIPANPSEQGNDQRKFLMPAALSASTAQDQSIVQANGGGVSSRRTATVPRRVPTPAQLESFQPIAPPSTDIAACPHLQIPTCPEQSPALDTASVAGDSLECENLAAMPATVLNGGPPILRGDALAAAMESAFPEMTPPQEQPASNVPANLPTAETEPATQSLFVDLNRFRVQRTIPTEPIDMTLADGNAARAAQFSLDASLQDTQEPSGQPPITSVQRAPDPETLRQQEADREASLLARMREPLPASPLNRVQVRGELQQQLVEPERFTERHYGSYQQTAMIEYGPRQLSYVQWTPQMYAWAAPNFYHRPLYYEEPNLERYGFDYGCAQPVYSAGHFFVSTALLPMQIGGDHPCSCAYSLGYFRPGSCNPAYVARYPVTPRGLIYQTLSTVGLVAIVP